MLATPPRRLDLRPLLMLLALLCLCAGALAQQQATAGRVILALGDPVARSADGAERPMARGAIVRRGDTLVTGPTGRLQIRFTDGSRLALRPGSELAVDEYAFEAEAPPREARVGLRLSRGGFRTVTGRIAERNREAYRIRTPFAVVGVRGTDWSANIDDIGQGDNLFLGVNDGGIFAENDGGSLDLGDAADFDFAVVRSFTEAPQGLTAPPPALGATLAIPLPSDDDDGSGDEAPPVAGAGDDVPGGGPDDGGEAEADASDEGPEIVIGGAGDEDADGAVFLTSSTEDGGDEEPVFAVNRRCL